MTPEERRARVADIVTRRHQGESLDSIGARHGISRERVRQIVARHAPETPSRVAGPIDPLAIVRAIRDPRTMTWAQVSGDPRNIQPVRRCAEALGLLPAANRLFRWRANAARRRWIITQIQRFAATRGRAPTAADMNRAGNGLSGTVVLYRAFPSITAALAAAGLPPNPRGMHARTRVPY